MGWTLKTPKTKTTNKVYAFLTDPHVPYEDVKTCRAVFSYLGDVRWDGVILGGDVLDMDAVSFWEQGKPGLQEGKRLSDEYDAGNSWLWLANLEYVARRKNKNAKIYYIEGNHENRVERDLERNPRYRGLVDVPVNMNLKKRNIEWVRSWSRSETVKIGKMELMHGDYATDWHAKKHVIERGRSVGYGHTHTVQAYPLQYRGRDSTLQGKSYGCLCDYELSYRLPVRLRAIVYAWAPEQMAASHR
jgi:predicted phosphodiesterase